MAKVESSLSSNLSTEIPSYSRLSDNEAEQDFHAPRDLSVLDIGKRVVAGIAAVIASSAVLDGCGGTDDHGDDSPGIGTIRSGMTIEESFAAENFSPMPPEVNIPDSLGVTECYRYDENTIRWYVTESTGDFTVRQADLSLNSDGTISIISPVATVSDVGFVTNAGNEYLLIIGGIQRNGEEIIDWGVPAFDKYIDNGNIILGWGSRMRGFTPTGDISTFPESYSGPLITTSDALNSNTTFIPELNVDPADPNEAFLIRRAVFSSERAYISKRCIRGVSTCITTSDASTLDIYMKNFNQATGTWSSEPMIKVASTTTDGETASCVFETPNAECIIIEGATSDPFFDYACHLKDSDGDTVVNFDDNCVSIPNPDQSDVDSDGIGDACDTPVITPDIGVDAPLDAGTPDSPPLLDSDGDGVHDGIDNCLFIANPSQEDSDSDWFGNPCDNCPEVANEGQEDSNGNGIGDVCEPVTPDAGVDVSPDAPLPDVDIPDAPVPDVAPDAPQPDVVSPPDAGVDAAGEKPKDSEIPADTQSSSDTRPSADAETPKDPPPGCSCDVGEKPDDETDLSFQALVLAASTVIATRKRQKS